MSTDNNLAIEVRHLFKKYKLYNRSTDRLKEALFFGGKKKLHIDFYALDDVSFTVKKGETVGIIGTNGSGKSTLLKIIAGVLQPTSGTVKVSGKVAALLELGAGFNPEYTGLENIYLSGAIMGYTKEQIEKKIDEIVQFADIGIHINQPVKTYSSGMFARLAFAVAINVEPDVFIIDEALSVGDMFFQEKSFTRMKKFRQEGKTILFVSHSLPSVRNFCDRAIWIEKGKIKMDGDATVVCSEYQDYLNANIEEVRQREFEVNQTNKIYIRKIALNKDKYQTDEDIRIQIELGFNENIEKFGVGVIISDIRGKIVTLFNTVRDDIFFHAPIERIELVIPNNDFLKGKYYVSVNICDDLIMFPYDRQDYIASFEIEDKLNRNGVPVAEGMFRCKHEWHY